MDLVVQFSEPFLQPVEFPKEDRKKELEAPLCVALDALLGPAMDIAVDDIFLKLRGLVGTAARSKLQAMENAANLLYGEAVLRRVQCVVCRERGLKTVPIDKRSAIVIRFVKRIIDVRKVVRPNLRECGSDAFSAFV